MIVFNIQYLQVYLSAIDGHVPKEMVQTFRAFLDFCYIARRDVQDTASLQALEDALARFHCHRRIFQECGVREGFCLPRQHSLVHYLRLIRAFGAPNGLCSSITECKHIKAVKKPWRRSNHYEALGQMLLTNQRLDKLAASRVDFAARGMLEGNCLESMLLMLGMPIFSSFCKTLQLVKDVKNANDNANRNAPEPQQTNHTNANAGVNNDGNSDDDNGDDDDNDNDDNGEMPGPRILACTKLSKTART